MKKEPLVSVIIPTYNRAHLIGETLDSVLAQTYQNWECIIVDDGSSDHTDKVVGKYVQKDSRFKYYHRPDEHLPGGNGARNYGFKMSQGEYIQWFDSDDLMVAEKLELKVKAILENDVDFVVSKTKYFNIEKKNPYAYAYDSKDINFINYSTTYLSWFTPDIFLKKNIIVSNGIKFSEKLKAGQEYNFSCKLLIFTNNVLKLNHFLTLRRYHLNSIGKKRQKDKKLYWKTNFDLHWTTLNELKTLNTHLGKYPRYALFKCIRSYIESNFSIKLNLKFHKAIFKTYGFKALYFYSAIISSKIFKKKEFLLTKLKSTL